MQNDTFKEYFHYTSRLLNAQYDVSEIIQHKLTRGEVREDFLKEIVEKSFAQDIVFHKGIVVIDDQKHKQVDLFLPRYGSLKPQLGSKTMIAPEDCKLIVEVKSNSTGTEVKDFDRLVRRINELDLSSRPLCGMFCYQVKLQRKELLKRFGFAYDETTDTYFDDASLPLEYAFMDFFICIDDKPKKSDNGNESPNTHLFLRKNTDAEGRYILSDVYPAMTGFLQLVKSVLRS